MLKIGTRVVLSGLFQTFSKPLAVSIIKKPNLPAVNVQAIRSTSFFNRLTQEQLWKGVVTVSNAGKRRGRGKGGDARGRRNLNEGQKIGEGKIRVLWPGLNQSILGTGGIRQIQKLPDTEQKESPPTPSQIRLRRSRKCHPFDRGWSGKTAKGKQLGPPLPIQDETFEGFQSIIIDFEMKTQMSGTLGRKRIYYAMVATGNSNGLIGVGTSRTPDASVAINLAKRRASRRLLTIDLIDKGTINHSFFSEYGRTKLFALKKPEGYGLACHRIIMALCKLIGIENLYVKVEGAINPKAIVRAFIVGLLRQKSYQEIANEKKLHVVEMREETFNFPLVLASPEECLTPAEARKDHQLFEEYIMGGKLPYFKGPEIPFYKKLPSWSRHLRRVLYSRNHDKVRVHLLAKYGKFVSHLTKVYPECNSSIRRVTKDES